MDWGVIAQATFFISVTLLALLVTVFVLATSLLGLAVERARSEQEEEEGKRKEETSKEFNTVKRELEKAEQSKDPKGIAKLSKLLARLGRQLKKDEIAVESIGEKYRRPFTMEGGIYYPGICFLLSSIFSGIAWSLAETDLTLYTSKFYLGYLFFPKLYFPVNLVVLSLCGVALVWGIYWLCSSLSIIQKVSVTSDEAALRRMIDATIKAQDYLEAQRRPQLELLLEDPRPPIQIQTGAEVSLKFAYSLVKGDSAQRVSVFFLVPQSFDFPGVKFKSALKGAGEYSGYLCTNLSLEDLIAGVEYRGAITIKSPKKTGKFRLAYRLQCEQFVDDFREFDVEVTS